MLVYRTPATRYIALDWQALNVFLHECQFEDAFLRDLGIFLLPEELDEEDALCDDSPVSNNLFLYTHQQSEEGLNRRLLELIRECALEADAAPWEAASFLGVQEVEDWWQDIQAFGSLAEQHQFVHITQALQPPCEHDLSEEEVQGCLGQESSSGQRETLSSQLGMLIVVLVCLVRIVDWLKRSRRKEKQGECNALSVSSVQEVKS